MPHSVVIHPTAKVALKVLVIGLFVGLFFVSWKRRSTPLHGQIQVGVTANTYREVLTEGELFLPIIELSLIDASLEASWSKALSQHLAATTEVPVNHGRIDVLSKAYAIEVDRLDKWHEAIGQASHYAHETKMAGAIALIVASDLWPLSEATKSKIRTIDETCMSKNIKLVLLRRKG